MEQNCVNMLIKYEPANVVTFLTPFSISPITDTAVDSLPALFLTYCMLRKTDDDISIDDRITPRPSALDPTPLYSPY